MRLNLKHVGLIATSNPHLNVKSGWLSISDKGSKGGSSAFKLRWVVLKGNFLFFFRKEVQHASELAGCILLEKFSLRVSNEKIFEFCLSFEQYSQSEVAFRARSTAELGRWREVISTCCHEYTRAVHALVAKRSEAFGLKALAFDPMKTYPDGTPMERVAFADYRALGELQAPNKRDTIKVLRLGMSAIALKGAPNSPLQPSCYIKVQVKYVSWVDYMTRTDVKREVDPVFANELVFKYNESLGPKFKQTHVRFIVYMDNGASGALRSSTGSQKRDFSAFRPVALAECQLNDVVDRPEKQISLPLRSYADAAVVMKSALRLRVIGDAVDDPEDTTTAGSVVRLGKKIEGPIYKFPSAADSVQGAGGTVRATEVMGESAYFREMPEKLLKIYVDEDRRLIERAASLGDAISVDKWDDKVGPWFEHINHRLKLYLDHLSTLSTHPLYYRKSVDKKSKELEMTALNCHIQRMKVLEMEGTGVAAQYDTVTHGAPAAHSLGFKHGGLRSILMKEGRKKNVWDEVDAHVRQMEQISDKVGKVLETLSCRFPKTSVGAAAVPAAAPPGAGAAPKAASSVSSDTDFSRLPQHSGADEEEEDEVFGEPHGSAAPAPLPAVRTEEDFFGAADFEALEDALSEARLIPNLVANDFLGAALANTARIRVASAAAPASSRTASPKRPTKGRDGGQISKAIFDGVARVNAAKTEKCAGEVIGALRDLWKEIRTAVHEVDIAGLLTAISYEKSDEVTHRHDICFSQACTCLATSFVATLLNRRKDDNFLKQLYSIGFLVQFESLLSTHGKEEGMIEDMSVAVELLRGVSFRLEQAPEGVEPFSQVYVQGTRYRVCITLEVPPGLYDRLPSTVIKSGGLIPVMPVFFSHGVNEMQTIANKLGEADLQGDIVTKGVRDLKRYCDEYKRFALKVLERADSTRLIQEIDKMLTSLEIAVASDKSKNVDILTLSEDIARRVNGGRLTCCKSGKDRTGMSVTLEQARILISEHGMEPSKLHEALHLMRSMGTRMDNVEKNIGQRKYAFNKIQVYTLPKLLRPPIMNIGGSIT